MAVEGMIEQMKAEFSESMEFIAALCSASTAMGDVLASFNHELEKISAQNFSLRRAIRESYARDRARDQTIETLTTKITELQRRRMKCQESHKSETRQCQCHINKILAVMFSKQNWTSFNKVCNSWHLIYGNLIFILRCDVRDMLVQAGQNHIHPMNMSCQCLDTT
ncbi:hypothetical protein CTI12_AA536760 [Artemisia annua]|uniref:Uncharacterized protein n=1 Tax=Artemisia annua TaxID=35608 RepID=A0A2U1L182_ARTAN|nr:hypothetical protein CTI12_AA536760 [Artemisia annua]